VQHYRQKFFHTPTNKLRVLEYTLLDYMAHNNGDLPPDAQHMAQHAWSYKRWKINVELCRVYLRDVAHAGGEGLPSYAFASAGLCSDSDSEWYVMYILVGWGGARSYNSGHFNLQPDPATGHYPVWTLQNCVADCIRPMIQANVATISGDIRGWHFYSHDTPRPGAPAAAAGAVIPLLFGNGCERRIHNLVTQRRGTDLRGISTIPEYCRVGHSPGFDDIRGEYEELVDVFENQATSFTAEGDLTTAGIARAVEHLNQQIS